jgi:hypothetical protein
MADAALFTGWGDPVRGREQKGLEIFNEALTYWGQQQESGGIESFEVVFLYPHGGDLAGFILAKGSQEQIAAIRASEEFDRLNVRAAQIVENFGVVDAAVDDGVATQVQLYQEAVNELGG